jgi:hypothetical protein
MNEWLIRLLDQRDPEGLLRGSNPGREYRFEVPRIVAALRRAQSLEEFTEELYSVFVSYFGADAVAPRDVYVELAREIYCSP